MGIVTNGDYRIETIKHVLLSMQHQLVVLHNLSLFDSKLGVPFRPFLVREYILLWFGKYGPYYMDEMCPHKSLWNFKSLRFFGDFDHVPKQIPSPIGDLKKKKF